MKIIVEINIDETQWPEDRLEQYKHNLSMGVGAALDQTVWYRNDISPDVDYTIRTEKD